MDKIPLSQFFLPSVFRMWLFSPPRHQEATSPASLFCSAPPSQVKPSWGLRDCTRSCTNCNMTSRWWRESPFWWARCRACTRYASRSATLCSALPAAAEQPPRESRYHPAYIMKGGRGVLGEAVTAGRGVDVTICSDSLGEIIFLTCISSHPPKNLFLLSFFSFFCYWLEY